MLRFVQLLLEEACSQIIAHCEFLHLGEDKNYAAKVSHATIRSRARARLQAAIQAYQDQSVIQVGREFAIPIGLFNDYLVETDRRSSALDQGVLIRVKCKAVMQECAEFEDIEDSTIIARLPARAYDRLVVLPVQFSAPLAHGDTVYAQWPDSTVFYPATVVSVSRSGMVTCRSIGDENEITCSSGNVIFFLPAACNAGRN